MDNERLEPILTDGSNRTFWLKPVGLPGSRADGQEYWDADPLRVDFAVRPVAVEVGDVLLAFRIGDSQLIYIAECVAGMREATLEEIERSTNRARWRWYIEARNLTREFGRLWQQYDLRPFQLVAEYNALHTAEPENINGLAFGRDKLRVSRPFAEFVIRMIAGLQQPAAIGPNPSLQRTAAP